MGRLMDSVLAAVGYKPSDRDEGLVFRSHPMFNRPNPNDIAPWSNPNDITPPNIDQKQAEELAAQAIAAAATANSAIDASTEEQGENKFVPMGLIEKIGGEECTSCKYVSLATLLGIGGLLVRECNKQSKKFTGVKAMAMKGQGIFAAAACATLGIARVLEIGPYTKGKEHYDAKDHIYSDTIDTFKFLNVKTPSLFGLDTWVPPTPEEKEIEAQQAKEKKEREAEQAKQAFKKFMNKKEPTE